MAGRPTMQTSRNLFGARDQLCAQRIELPTLATWLSVTVNSSRCKAREAYFTAPSHTRRKFKGSTNVNSIHVSKDDEVVIRQGHYHQRESEVVQEYGKKLKIRIERVVRNKANERTVPI